MYEGTKINSVIVPSLNNTKTNIKQASYSAAKLNSPDNFSGGSKIANIKASLSDIEKDIDKVLDWISKCDTTIKNRELSINDDVALVKQVLIKYEEKKKIEERVEL